MNSLLHTVLEILYINRENAKLLISFLEISLIKEIPVSLK